MLSFFCACTEESSEKETAKRNRIYSSDSSYCDTTFNRSGGIEMIKYFNKNSELIKSIEFWQNSNPFKLEKYKNGVKDDSDVLYYSNGNIDYLLFHVNSLTDGDYFHYREDGRIWEYLFFWSDTIIYSQTYDTMLNVIEQEGEAPYRFIWNGDNPRKINDSCFFIIYGASPPNTEIIYTIKNKSKTVANTANPAFPMIYSFRPKNKGNETFECTIKFKDKKSGKIKTYKYSMTFKVY